jgi:hypothetical protein
VIHDGDRGVCFRDENQLNGNHGQRRQP